MPHHSEVRLARLKLFEPMKSSAMNATNGIISQPSQYSVTETINRLEAVLQAKGITIFVRIDQQAEAEKVGLILRPTQYHEKITFKTCPPESPSPHCSCFLFRHDFGFSGVGQLLASGC